MNKDIYMDTDILKEEYNKNECGDPKKVYSKSCNSFLLKRELTERKELEKEKSNDSENELYPDLNDKKFILKIAEKKEFHDYGYDGHIPDSLQEFKKHIDELSNMDFELQPHQSFVKNFMSSQTPYNSLLLFHQLGTGKTCSSIGVSEEMRSYYKQTGNTKRIIIVASENVQDNFRLQLFDERKLEFKNGDWNISGCVGNKLLKEVNLMNTFQEGEENRKRIVSKINTLINNSYVFMGYIQFANYILKTAGNIRFKEMVDTGMNNEEKKKVIREQLKSKVPLSNSVIQRIRNEFDDRMIIIDEIHNIRKSEDNKNKKVAYYLELLVGIAYNMKLLLLSATPMFNTYSEIIWLLNIMNMNDKRGKIEGKDIFEKDGSFKEGGEELLIRKSTGYVSFVRGENPYTFPYRVYPNVFSPEKSFHKISYPDYQLNRKKISSLDKKRIIDLYLTRCGDTQNKAYNYVISELRENFENIEDVNMFQEMGSFGYTLLQTPIQCLNISYPMEELETFAYSPSSINSNSDIQPPIQKRQKERKNEFPIASSDLTGKGGLKRMMKYNANRSHFEYKKETLEKYGKIFTRKEIGKYSSKIENILQSIVSDEGIISEGIILIYSQYLDAGLIPMALALEEMGFTRFGNGATPFFSTRHTEVVDVRTMKPPKSKKDFLPARYSMITGDQTISPDNDFEVKGLTNKDNVYGENVKVVLISQAGSEGIDFKFIRQVHILEPWYNLNRLEQVIGRGVRNFSHKDLPFEKRNVEIFMYGTILDNREEESADLYVYRTAEYKSIQIGKITRLLKETAVDCIIHHAQTNFTQEMIHSKIGNSVKQILSVDNKVIHHFKIGDMPFTPACDYMATCEYDCKPSANKKIVVNEDTYNETYASLQMDKITTRVQMLMKESFFYKKKEFIRLIQIPKEYPLVQIYFCLTNIIDNHEVIVDKYGRSGELVNIGNYYLFQPRELLDKNASILERSVPIPYKSPSVALNIEYKKEELAISDSFHTFFRELSEKFLLVLEYTNEESSISRNDKTDLWYKYSGKVIHFINKTYSFEKKILLSFVVHHLIEKLNYEEKIQLINYIYSYSESEKENDFILYAKEYFIRHSITKRNSSFILLYDENEEEKKLFKLENPTKWIPATPLENISIMNDPIFQREKQNFNDIVGFMGYVKKELFFKTKSMIDTRNTGIVCHPKPKSILLLNQIIQEKGKFGEYNEENTKKIKDIELCILLEMIMRYYENYEIKGKRWFVSPEMSIVYGLNKVVDKKSKK
jgi:hypothetical protein